MIFDNKTLKTVFNMKYTLFYKSISVFIIYMMFSVLVACDPGSTINYEVVNKTNTSLIVKYRFAFTLAGDTSIKEVSLLPNSKMIINSERVLGYANRIDKARDSIYLYKLTIESNNKLSHSNFKNKKYWTFLINSNQMGTYSLNIDSSFF